MASKTTRSTNKLSHSERHVLNVSALATGLARISRIDFHQLRTACYSFGFQALDESTPRSIRYVFSKMVIPHHVFDIQILNSNKRMGFGYYVSQFEGKIYSLVSNFFIEPAQSETRFSPVSRAFDFPAYSTMQEFQSIFVLDKIVRISNKLSVGECGKILQADINADFGVGTSMDDFSFRHLTAKSGKPFSAFGLLDGKSFNIAFWNSVEYDWQIANLADFNVFAADKLKSALRISYAINSAFVSGKTFFFAGFIFNSAKKISKGFMHPVRNILLGLRMNLLKLTSKILIEIKFIKGYIAKLVSIFVERKNLVINLLASDKRTEQSDFLFPARINPEFIRQQAHVNWLDDILYKAYAGMSSGIVPIHPTAKAVGILGTEL